MRIAFCGKGGSGKSTVSSLFARYLASLDKPVLVVDGDINQHLGAALGFSDEEIAGQTRLGIEPGVLKKYVCGDNPRIPSVEQLAETTPAGHGSGLVWFNDSNPVYDTYQIERDGIRFMAIGGHTDKDAGAACYHKFTGAFEILLNHMIDGPSEYVIGDMCAGADPFASCSLAARFDAVFLVVEPTLKSVGVYDQCCQYVKNYGVKIYVIGNKVEDEADESFIRKHVGDALIGCFGNSKFVRNHEKGIWQDIDTLEPEHRAMLEKIKNTTDALTRDWKKFREISVEFHRKVADYWGDKWYGTNLMDQIDPEFRQEDLITNGNRKVA